MHFGYEYLFNKRPEDMRRIGALGGRARGRNLRLRKAGQLLVSRKPTQLRQETTAEAIRRIERLCPWLVGWGGVRQGVNTAWARTCHMELMTAASTTRRAMRIPANAITAGIAVRPATWMMPSRRR
jgi:hypothetical protein